MTYSEAIKAGYREAFSSWQVGYVSRKNFCLENAPVKEAGGIRKGLVFVLLPSWESTRFCVRLYLEKP